MNFSVSCPLPYAPEPGRRRPFKWMVRDQGRRTKSAAPIMDWESSGEGSRRRRERAWDRAIVWANQHLHPFHDCSVKYPGWVRFWEQESEPDRLDMGALWTLADLPEGSAGSCWYVRRLLRSYSAQI